MRIRLQPKQEDCFDLLNSSGPESPTWIGYGGSRGGAKSNLARSAMVLRRLKYKPGTAGFIIRRNYGDLYDNHLIKFQEEYPEFDQFYNSGNKEYQFDNGSRIAFRYADTLGEIRKLARGPEAMDIYVDQAEQFSEEELNLLHTLNRWPGSKQGECKMGLFFNPGGTGTQFLRRVFHLKQFHDAERPTDYAFVHAYGWDNYEWFREECGVADTEFYQLTSEERFAIFIERTSYGRILNQLPEHLKLGELLGSFDKFGGQYFAGAWDETKCVLKPSVVNDLIQPWWVRWMGQDWGFGDHAAHYWFASGKVKPSDWMKYFGGHTEYAMDIVIAYREHVISNRAEADLATDIVGMTEAWERKQIRRFFLSQDAFGQRAKQGGNTVGETFTRVLTRYGLPSPETADQNRVMGWRFMYNCLRQANLVGANISEERSKQGPAFFISAECPQAIASIPMAIRAEDDVDDVERVAGAIWEDVTDGLRYGLHTMLNPRTKAPMDVRAREVYDSIQGADASDVMTARALAMAKFKHDEGVIRRVQRMPRWR